jgi:hypothetical protein
MLSVTGKYPMPTVAEIEKLLPAAKHLIAKRYRFIETAQAGAIASKFGLSRDQMKTAIVLADRLRRQQQLFEKHPGFRVDGMVDITAPINLAPVQPSPEEIERRQAESLRKWREHKAAQEAARKSEPQEWTMPGKHKRIPIERQVWIGQQLLAVKAKLPHGHFRAWVENNSGLTWSQASRLVRLAREAAQREEGSSRTTEPKSADARQRADMGQIAA